MLGYRVKMIPSQERFIFCAATAIIISLNLLTVSAGIIEQNVEDVVSTPSGKVRGSTLQSWTKKTFYAFRGIPYAEPPIGDLRFKAPVSKKPWEGIKDATHDGKTCYQNTEKSFGEESEDCLLLNVYTKNINGSQPVIVFFHPGGYYAGTGASYVFGPQRLLEHDIVLVTINYRLDALGFLSTEDKTYVGNYGMKDQVEALRWVKKHIASFGGNPNQVTIAGYSAGSSSALLHMLSPMSRGLFHRVIAMSSGVTSEVLIAKHPLDNAKRLAKLLNCPTDDSVKLVDCLKKYPAKDINSKFNEQRLIAGLPMIRFGPVIEQDLGTGEERFLTGDPATLLKSKQFYQVPVVAGVTELEFDAWFQDIFHDDSKREKFIKNFDSIAPEIFEYDDRNSTEVQRITNSMKKFYFGDKQIDKYSVYDLGKWFSDFSVIFSGYTTLKYLTFFSDQPVYFYIFTYKGPFGHVKNITTGEVIGPTHHDDLLYLFDVPKFYSEIKENSPEGTIAKIETSIWKNFATIGNPTPDNSPVQWPPLQKTSFKYLNINLNLKLQDTSESPFGQRVYHYETTIH